MRLNWERKTSLGGEINQMTLTSRHRHDGMIVKGIVLKLPVLLVHVYIPYSNKIAFLLYCGVQLASSLATEFKDVSELLRIIKDPVRTSVFPSDFTNFIRI